MAGNLAGLGGNTSHSQIPPPIGQGRCCLSQDPRTWSDLVTDLEVKVRQASSMTTITSNQTLGDLWLWEEDRWLTRPELERTWTLLAPNRARKLGISKL